MLFLLLLLYGLGSRLLYLSSSPAIKSTLQKQPRHFRHRKPIVSGKAAIITLARDLGETTVETRLAPFLTEVGQLFEHYFIIVVESNSYDDTQSQLLKWQAWAPHVNLVLESGQHDMAYWRNLYLQQVQNDASLDYMVVVDSDMKEISIEGIVNSLTQHSETNWAALVANGQRSVDRAYYDIFATRADWNGYTFPVESNEDTVEIGQYIRRFTVKINATGDALIPVHSGFGGVGIYKTKYLHRCKYCRHNCSVPMVVGDCEHVPFHNCIEKRNGGSIFINPKMTTTWHHGCSDCCADLDLPCEICYCAPPLVNYTWEGVTYRVA